MALVTVFLVLGLSHATWAWQGMEFPLLMPDVQPLQVGSHAAHRTLTKHMLGSILQKDTYFCTSFKLPRLDHEYIGKVRG